MEPIITPFEKIYETTVASSVLVPFPEGNTGLPQPFRSQEKTINKGMAMTQKKGPHRPIEGTENFWKLYQ